MGLSDYWKNKKTGPSLQKSSSMLHPSFTSAGHDNPVTAINQNSSDGSWNMSDGSISITADDGSTWNTGRHIQRCYDSNNCASGWSCINGTCAQSDPGSGGVGGSTSGCGNSQDNNDCGSTGEPQGCTKGICGKPGISPGDETCCNQERCCQKGDDGLVRCTCGPCPPPKVTCDAFCAAFYAAYGRRTMGCTEENTCTQCEECRLVESFQPRQCVPLEPEDANCWCPQSIDDPPEECMKCLAVGGWVEDCENCQACYTVSVDCGCARNTQKCCEPGCITTKGQRSCTEKAWANCYAACTPPEEEDPSEDPCAGECYGQNFCDGPPPPCPDGASCTDNGTISAGGRTCYIRTVCDKTNVPEECKECDCNCEDDCPDCKICNAAGECVDDPACDEPTKWVIYRTVSKSQFVAASYSFAGGPVNNCDTQAEEPDVTYNGVVYEYDDVAEGSDTVFAKQLGPQVTSGYDVPVWCVGPGPYTKTNFCLARGGTCLRNLNWSYGSWLTTASGGGQQNTLYTMTGGYSETIVYSKDMPSVDQGREPSAPSFPAPEPPLRSDDP